MEGKENLYEDFKPETWFEMYRYLSISAETLYNKFMEIRNQRKPVDNRETYLAHFQTYMMVQGFALENLLKCASIHFHFRDKKYKVITRFDDLKGIWGGDGHNLVGISEDCGIDFTADDLAMFERYQHFTKWAGRYYHDRDPMKSKRIEEAGDLKFRSRDVKRIKEIEAIIRKRIGES